MDLLPHPGQPMLYLGRVWEEGPPVGRAPERWLGSFTHGAIVAVDWQRS